MANVVEQALKKVRSLALALPGAQERASHSFPTFFVGKRVFAYFVNNHHGDGRLAVLLKVGMEGQDLLVRGDPSRFYVPPYVGHQGFVGVRLEGAAPWAQVADLMQRSFEAVLPVPKKSAAAKRRVAAGAKTTRPGARATSRGRR